MNLEQPSIQEQRPSHYSTKQSHLPPKKVLDDLVQKFLDLKALCKSNISWPQTKPEKGRLQSLQVDREISSANQTHAQLKFKKRSIFHNFQKHLITLLKNNIKIDYKCIQETFVGQLCRRMWQSFKKTHSYNKQVLHMIFGFRTTKKHEPQLKKIAQKYQQFSFIYDSNEVQKIVEVQAIFRRTVVKQMQSISKDELQVSCKMQKFELFYEYLQSFILELTEGPITSRMLKSRKTMVLSNFTKSNSYQ